MNAAPDWIAAEAGPGGLRLWAMRGAEVAARQDVADLAAARAAWPGLPLLLAAPEDWPGLPEARPVPATGLVLHPAPDADRVWLVGPLAQQDPPDRLAGGAAQVAGLLEAQPHFDGVALLTGPRSHWLRLSAGEICHFHSFLTGELLALLSAAAPDGAGFDETLDEALSRPHRAYGRLAALRDTGDGARLAGLLVGLELAAAKPYWLGQQVAILGEAPLRDLYARALAAQGVATLQPDPESALLAGLHAAWKGLAAAG